MLNIFKTNAYLICVLAKKVETTRQRKSREEREEDDAIYESRRQAKLCAEASQARLLADMRRSTEDTWTRDLGLSLSTIGIQPPVTVADSDSASAAPSTARSATLGSHTTTDSEDNMSDSSEISVDSSNMSN